MTIRMPGQELLADGLCTVEHAAGLTGFTEDYVRRLARKGKIRAHKIADIWLVNEDDLTAWKQAVDSLGTSKHNPEGVQI